jgi:hypothetical protein
VPTKTEVNLARLCQLIGDLEPELSPDTIADAVRTAAPETAILGKLVRAIATNPQQLLTSKAAAIPAHSRLATALLGRGARRVAIPECGLCNRPVVLEYAFHDRRICRSCFSAQNVAACTRCHRLRPIITRINGLPLCAACRTADVRFHEACNKCGKLAVPAARQEGKPLCQLCYERPKQICSSCGDLEPVHTNRPRVLCKRCYDSLAKGKAISTRPREKRLNFRQANCSVCGRHRLCKDYLTPRPLCAECAGRTSRTCVSCRRDRPAQAIWTIGPVCNTCYDGKRGRCGRCNGMGLIVRVDGESICHQCAGRPTSNNCAACGKADRLYENRQCAHCVLDQRLRELLPDQTDKSKISFVPVRELLLQHSEPKTIIAWLRKSPLGVALLSALARGEIEVSHRAIDQLKPHKSHGFVRSLLVSAGLLPERSNSFARLLPWFERFIERHSADRNILETFAQWHVFRRLRHKGEHNTLSEAGNKWARDRIRAAAAFLDHLRSTGNALESCRQSNLDEWLATGPTTAYTVRDFVRWAAHRKLAANLVVPLRKVLSAAKPVASDDRWATIRRVIDGDIKEIDLRIAGALNLLFGQQASRIVQLTDRHVVTEGDDVCVILGRESVPFPPPFDKLIQELVALRQSQPRARSQSGSAYLFPGKFYGRPSEVGRFTERLNAVGINARDGRNATLMDLAAKMPAPMLRDLLGLHINTAVDWNRAAGHSHARYVGRLKRHHDKLRKPRRVLTT